jgi:hypothetical protein
MGPSGHTLADSSSGWPICISSLQQARSRRFPDGAGQPPTTPLQTLWPVNNHTGKQFTIHGKPLTAEPYDLGMVELRQEVVEQLQGFRFLTLSEIRPAPAQGIFVVCGFPEESQSRTLLNAFVYITHAYDGPQAGLNFDLKTDLPLVWDRSFSVSAEGSPVGMPDRLNGVSGGPTSTLESAAESSIENCGWSAWKPPRSGSTPTDTSSKW